MSENYDDKDIEKIIFVGGLTSAEIEPSEKFWNRAYENILQRENLTNANRSSRWRGAFFGMGTVIILLGAYSFYLHSQITELKQQVTQIKTVKVNTVTQGTSRTTPIISVQKESANKNLLAQSNSKSITHLNGTPSISYLSIKSSHILSNKEVRKNNYTSSNYSPKVTSTTSQIFATNGLPVNTFSTRPVATIPSHLENKAQATENTDTTNSTTNPAKTNDNIVIPPSTSSQIAQPTQTTVTSSGKKAARPVNALATDTAGSVFTPQKRVTLSDVLSKISVSGFYAPGATNDFLKDKNNDPANITATVLKTREDGDGTFATGLRLAYNLSDKWALQTGCSYSEYSYNIKPTVVYAQSQETGQVGYSIITSSGTVFIPYSAGPTHIGDSMKVKGSSSRGYISIPLQVKYNIYKSSKFCFYVDGGFSVNLANYQETQLHWLNTALQEGDVSVQNIYGLNNIQYSYNFGLGMAYIIRKRLSIYTEPYLDGSFTSINKNTPVSTYPYFFGWGFGITYRF